jgi:hypothetical protein
MSISMMIFQNGQSPCLLRLVPVVALVSTSDQPPKDGKTRGFGINR